MNILQEIFSDNFESIKYKLSTRDVEIKNIEKMIDCGNLSKGYAVYTCSKCDQYRYVPFRCKSRFCPTCGNKYSIDRALEMSFKLIDTSHRHCVFTIDENLRPFFLNDRSLLNCLFQAVRSTLLYMFHKINKSMNYTPGFVCVLHTFGRDLKWNPHIHAVVSEGGISNSGLWKKVKHFNYNFLRNSFRTSLLNLLEQHIGPSFKKTKSLCYRNNEHGFYVYAKPRETDVKKVIKYIGRYLGRPSIATSRIDKYDGNTVTFHYNRHEDEKLIVETIPVEEFITRLIRHIPEEQFKMIRYYGIYARHRKSDGKLRKHIAREKHHAFRNFNKWRSLIFSSFGYDPIKCPNCGATMTPESLYIKNEHISLDELYKKIMRKAHMEGF